ncbi:hypothetical protein LguiA_001716 [Lonicera macranthoides]
MVRAWLQKNNIYIHTYGSLIDSSQKDFIICFNRAPFDQSKEQFPEAELSPLPS